MIEHILGKFAPTAIIAKNFTQNMNKYFQRFARPDNKIRQDMIGWNLNAKHVSIARKYGLDQR